uniref:Uncharacterized protein n=1 Tax=Anguilla anguilla TaxID=7936 RepID=A0A0E9XTA5_ANGAN
MTRDKIMMLWLVKWASNLNAVGFVIKGDRLTVPLTMVPRLHCFSKYPGI